MPMPKSEKRTEAQRRAGQKYNAAHYAAIAANMKKEIADSFRAWCAGAGLTVSGALAAFVRAALAGDPDAARIASGAARSGDGVEGADGADVGQIGPEDVPPVP